MLFFPVVFLQEMGEKKPVRGLNWDKGAIGTAKWGGVRLRDVLVYAGLDPDHGDGMRLHGDMSYRLGLTAV